MSPGRRFPTLLLVKYRVNTIDIGLFGVEGVEPGVEPLVEGGVVGGAEAVGLVVFVLVPSFGEAGLLGIGDTLEVIDYIVV